jgi:hypothetical protein
MMNKRQCPEECDATMFNSITAAGHIKIINNTLKLFKNPQGLL